MSLFLLSLHAVPSGTCARFAKPSVLREHGDIVAVERYSGVVPWYGGVLGLYQTLIGERWGPDKFTGLWGVPARDRFHRALAGDRTLADTGGDRGAVRGSDGAAAAEAAVTMEEVATLGGPAAPAEDLGEWRAGVIDPYLAFYRQLEPGEEIVYTL